MDKKEQRRAAKAMEKAAEQEGITVSEYREDVEKAIDIGWNHSDPQVKRYWLRVAKGMKPTPEEFILFVAEEARKKKLLFP